MVALQWCSESGWCLLSPGHACLGQVCLSPSVLAPEPQLGAQPFALPACSQPPALACTSWPLFLPPQAVCVAVVLERQSVRLSVLPPGSHPAWSFQETPLGFSPPTPHLPPAASFQAGIEGQHGKTQGAEAGSGARKMPVEFRSGALVALVLFVVCPARGATEVIRVTFTDTSVTLACPWVNASVNSSDRGEISSQGTWTATEKQMEEIERGAVYLCVNKVPNHLLKIYVKGKVCEGCVDLSLGLMAGIILCDLLITLVVLTLVYFCSRSRVNTFKGGPRKGQPRGQKVDSPPPVPNPDYEPIRKGQKEVYAGLVPQIF
ncbi:hypothetical protein JRQ81_011321 [Phrynocephalus forsythii]|uniref:T-cell surface glycoprotein CD3 epsilon chain n=1 Tax=Phrynocephalus forsythii TaxID=171643 RepID=A0A9Q0XB34_9SAUR|nr:hypothetical protein JRQ81_011321 [Phrynocephalus forsythii]